MKEDWKLEIKLSELRAAFDAVLESLDEGPDGSLVINADYYWSLRPDEPFDALNVPSPTVGQYAETWGNLKEERAGDAGMTMPFHAVWLGEILVALGLEGAR